jgi:integrase/recombinase XerD
MKQAKVLTDKELKKVISYIEAFDRYAERNKAIILLTHYCGLRIIEVASLLVSDVINNKGDVNDVILLSSNQTRGNKSRRVFVSKKAKTALKRYSLQHKRTYNAYRRIYERVDIVGATSLSLLTHT